MGLNRSKGNMYDFVTHMHSHIEGACAFQCRYCYVQAMAERFGDASKKGATRMNYESLKVDYGHGKTIFIDHLNDLFCPAVGDGLIRLVLEHTKKYPNNKYVFQTKNPVRFLRWVYEMPADVMLGTTIESNFDSVVAKVSGAPVPSERFSAMLALKETGLPLFVTIEPIMWCDPVKLATWCAMLRPQLQFVNVGADSKGRGLEEPRRQDVLELLANLKEMGVPVKLKTNLARILGEVINGLCPM